jgi:hypothetical protein
LKVSVIRRDSAGALSKDPDDVVIRPDMVELYHAWPNGLRDRLPGNTSVKRFEAIIKLRLRHRHAAVAVRVFTQILLSNGRGWYRPYSRGLRLKQLKQIEAEFVVFFVVALPFSWQKFDGYKFIKK